MQRELPPWPKRMFEVVVQTASEVLPGRGSVATFHPTEAEPFWELALTPANDAAAPLHFFVSESDQGIDNFEAGSRAASFELWEEPEPRLERLRQIVRAVVERGCAEQIAFVGDEPFKVELILALPVDGETTYSRSWRPLHPRRSEAFRSLERIETRTYAPY